MRSERAKLLLSPIQRAVCVLALMGLIWLALRNAAILLLAQVQPSWALAFGPPSGEALAAAAGRARSPSAKLELAREALGHSPLSARPFVVAADSALTQDDELRATLWLEQAVVRNSRDADSRARLFHLYWRHARWAEGIDEGVALAQLRSSMADGIYQSFLVLLEDERGRAILARKLARGPDGDLPHWSERLFAMASPADRDRLRAMSADLGEDRPESPRHGKR